MPVKSAIKNYKATIKLHISIHALSLARANASATSYAHILKGEVESVEEVKNEP